MHAKSAHALPLRQPSSGGRERARVRHARAGYNGSVVLCRLLQRLAHDDLPRAQREAAASALYREVRRFAPGALYRRFPGLPEVVVEEAIHKVVLEASLGRSRFRGDDERAARAWCNRILHRYAIDHFRYRRNKVHLDDAPPVRAPADDDPVFAADLVDLFDRMIGVLSRLHRPRDLERVTTNVRVHIEAHLLGEDIEAQMMRYGDLGPDPTATERRRARDRIYQYRRRGKLAACAAWATLLETGEVSTVEADLLSRLLGCDEEPSENTAAERRTRAARAKTT